MAWLGADQLLADAVLDAGPEQVTPTEIGSATGALSEAEQAIAGRNEDKAQSALRRCGRWLAEFAQQVGVDVAAAAIGGGAARA